LRENSNIRYLNYLIGLVFMLGSVGAMYPYMSNAGKISSTLCGVFSALAPLIFNLGFVSFLLPALAGRAALFRSIFGCGMFLALSNLAASMSLIGPLICLWYYLSFGHQLELTWYVTQYYFDSNTVYTFLFAIILTSLADKPFNSLITMRRDWQQARLDETNSILEFRKSVLKE